MRTRLRFCRNNNVDFVSASSKCFECVLLYMGRLRRLIWVLVARTHAIKTNAGCVSTSSKCSYVLNANTKALARLLKWTDSPELLLLEHAMKTNIDFASTSMKCTYKLFQGREIF